MLGFELREEFTSWAMPPLRHIVKSLSDALASVRLRCDIKKPLIRGGILHNGGSLPLNGQHHGPLRRLKLFKKVTRTPAKGCQRLNIACDV
jgi:hypothetical protein